MNSIITFADERIQRGESSLTLVILSSVWPTSFEKCFDLGFDFDEFPVHLAERLLE